MKFSVISDIHGRIDEAITHINTVANDIDMLFVAGDVISHIEDLGSYIDFVDKLSKYKFDSFIVPGNHEFYGLNMNNDLYSKLERPNVNLLGINRIHKYYTNQVAIIGETLWTPADIRINDQMNDIKQIRNFTDNNLKMTHSKHLEYIDKSLDEHDMYKTKIVITHHAPHEKSISLIHKWSPLNKYFVANVDESIIKKADFWIHGHTHEANKYMIGDCTVICNPLGYTFEDTRLKMEIFETEE